jgi:hypothetical protein
MRTRCIPVGTSNPPHDVGCARRRSLVYRLAGAGQRLLGLPRIANAHAGGASDAGGGRSYRLADGLQMLENRAVGTLNAGLCATASPSVGPREANFFPYLSIQLPPVGDHLLGLGITRFCLAWKVRALTRLSPWGGLRARRFQRDISTQRVIGRGAFAWRDSWSPWCDIRAPSWHCAGLACDCHRCGRRSQGRCADRRSC